MKIHSYSLQDGQRISERLAFGKRGPDGRFAPSDNLSPHVAWSDVPEGTQSFALLWVDHDVPSVGDKVNKVGVTVPRGLARVDFSHWVLVDLSSELRGLAEGSHGRGVVARGKAASASPAGRPGINDYTSWFASDPEMAGEYLGCDGPCPPWNDERLHQYSMTIYALDLEKLPVEGSFTREQAVEAMQGHILAQASMTGSYALYEKAR